jgi:hypothetical protein
VKRWRAWLERMRRPRAPRSLLEALERIRPGTICRVTTPRGHEFCIMEASDFESLVAGAGYELKSLEPKSRLRS